MTGSRERAVAFVVARLSSSRLPAKQLREVGGLSILDRIMQALGEAAELDQVVLATVDEPENRPLQDLAARRGWELYWYPGAVDDVVGRLNSAADLYAAEICLLISADCPLVHGPSVDALVRAMRGSPQADYLALPPNARGEACLLEGVQVARARAWRRADAMSDRPELREHQFPVISRNPDRFLRVEAALPPALYGRRHRLSVDTWADLEFMQTLHSHLEAEGRAFVLPEAVALLRERPALRAVNAHVHQRRLVETLHPALFIVDAGGEFGYGHFMRCRELAGQLVERLSWPATFLLDDERAAHMAEACGFRVLWGALARAARPAPAGRREVAAGAAAADQGLLLVDISVRRQAPPGWRTALGGRAPVVVIDREDALAGEADLILYPGITGRARTDRLGLPPIVEGLEYLILRREVRRYQGLALARDIDLLVYLVDPAQREATLAMGRRRGWGVVAPGAFDEDFPALLARSRAFVSGYGHSFYEALALGCRPVAWPLSPAHRADALAFYRGTGLEPSIVDDVTMLEQALDGLFGGSPPVLPAVADGTPAIVQRLAALPESRQ